MNKYFILKRFTFIIYFFFFFNQAQFAQLIRVGVFNELNTHAVVFSVVKGSYLMSADGRAIQTYNEGQNLYIAKEGDSMRCMAVNNDFGLYKLLHFNAMTDSSVFSLRPVDPQANIRFYDDNVELSVQLGKLQTVNIVDIDKYIAGVIEAEGGFNASAEYYKTQAMLCRTYALNHLDKHSGENFNLCDGTHCQAYNGQCSGNSTVLKAAFETRRLVVTDADTGLIIAAFHSNCGGETENAGNVWLIHKPYLISVQDPYCQSQKNYRWEKKLSMEEWKQYLTNNGFHIKTDMPASLFNYTQYKRQRYYKIGNDSITFLKIRNDFNFHSAFFSVEIKGDNVEIHGRGYGHGVGLCQEGAMQMAKLGYDFRKIIQFYYPGVNITDFNAVSENKNPALKLLLKK